MRVLITGGTGLIGRALSANLAADGHEVIVLTRSTERARSARRAPRLPDGVQAERWDARSTEGGALPRLLLPFRLFAGGPLGSGNQWYSWIHLQDQVRALRFLIETEEAHGAFNLTAPNPATNGDLAKLIGKAMGRPAFFPVPGFAMRLAFGEVADVVLKGQRAVPQRLLDLGFEFQFPAAKAALKDLLG